MSESRLGTRSLFTMFRVRTPSQGSFLMLATVFVFIVASSCEARMIERNLIIPKHNTSDNMVNNGYLLGSRSCSENYSIFPCSTSIGGNIFLMVVYGLMMLKAAQLVSEGSDMLLAVLHPGFIGGLVLPILGASPDALIILVSGVATSEEDVKSQILVGMGLLAGSTVMLLTILWGCCIVVGRCDLQENRNGEIKMVSHILTKKFNLRETGISTDYQTKLSATIMMITVVPYVVVQIPKLFGRTVNFQFKLAGCILSICGLFCYCAYQVLYPWIQERNIDIAKERYQKILSIQKAVEFSNERWGNLINSDGSPNVQNLTKLFDFADEDKDEMLTESEVRLLIVGMGLSDSSTSGEMEVDKMVEKWISEFDNEEKDQKLSKNEFIAGMSKWIKHVTKWSGKEDKRKKASHDRNSFKHATNDAQSSLRALLQDDDESEKEDEGGENEPTRKPKIALIALSKILIGASLAGILADPLVDTIDQFSKLSGVPSFFVSFVATPFATNFSEAVSSIVFAQKKGRNHLSLAYSQIYGSVVMNNTMCLGIFLVVVLVRGLVWDFSSEVLVIFLVTLIMGTLSTIKDTFPLWMAILAFCLYPASIALVAILDYGFGWQ